MSQYFSSDKKSCDLYSSKVAIRFKSVSGKKYSSCHSSWADPSDVIKTNSSHWVKSTTSASYISAYAIDGWACTNQRRYRPISTSGEYFRIDLGKPMKVDEIRLVVVYNHFEHILSWKYNDPHFER